MSEHNIGAISSRAVRVLVMQARTAMTELSPVLVAMHGGGLISGTAEHGLREVAHLLDATAPATVMAVGYGVAPESGFDAAVDDCVNALSWLVRSATELDVDESRIVVVGQSAGGALAVSALLAASIEVRGLLLSAPMLDDTSDSPSMHAYAGTGTWDQGLEPCGLGGRAAGRLTHARPGRGFGSCLAGGVSSWTLGRPDSLLDEVTGFATRLWRAGADAELHVWSGAHHGFDLSVPDADVSRQAQSARRQWLARTLHQGLAA